MNNPQLGKAPRLLRLTTTPTTVIMAMINSRSAAVFYCAVAQAGATIRAPERCNS
jgi:hypothetical protein